MNVIGALAIMLLFKQHVEARSRIDPLVDTKVGLIRGLRASDGTFSKFLGIPFGKVDKANPFGASLPYPKFDGIFEAFEEPSRCPQIDELTGNPIGSLDCLRLNIYVPASAHSKNRLPVLVWFHGGAFIRGSGNSDTYDPKFIIRHDVIFVSLQYRLGPYGFMCLGTSEIPGNQGLKDQVMALRWINNNIESFGGDLNRITIFGVSAGAKSVDLHLFSDQEKLFNSVILNSGSAFAPEVGSDPDLQSPLKLAELLGLSTTNITEAISFLSKSDPALVAAAATRIDRMFPCVEKEFENVESFLSDFPLNINPKKVMGTPILLGFTSHECVYCLSDQTPEYFANFNEFYNKLNWSFSFEETKRQEMAALLRHYYVGDKDSKDSHRLELSLFETDYKYVYPAKRNIERYIQNGASKMFFYMFSYNGQRNFNLQFINFTLDGSVHGEDMAYIFDKPSENFPEISSADQLIINRMTTMWTNFIKYGDPTPFETSKLLPVKWEPITSSDSPHYYMNINSVMRLGKRPYHDRVAFWGLFYEYNKKYQKGYNIN